MQTGEYIGGSFGLLGVLLFFVVAFLAITVLCIPKTVVKTAPKDIAEIVQKRPDEPMLKKILGTACAVLILLGIAFVLVWAGYDAVRNTVGFWLIFARYVILLAGYKLFDMVCFDWILLTKLHIFQKLFPETVGCKEYQKFGFNFKSQIIKLCGFILLSAAVAAILTHL